MANYGSDDENSSNSSNSSSDENSDVEIENRMKKKKKSFERLEADILENCENLAKDHENREEKWKSGIPTQGMGPSLYYVSKGTGWVGLEKWQFLLMFSTIYDDIGWVGQKSPKMG